MSEILNKLNIDDALYHTEIPENSRKSFDGMPDPKEIRTIIPGTIYKVMVTKGQKISRGKVVIVLEAMKMLIDVEAKMAGSIKEIQISSGDKVEKGQLLIRLGK